MFVRSVAYSFVAHVPTDAQITYELYYTPALAESAKEGSELSVLSEMDRRMAQLEKLLGANTFMVRWPAALCAHGQTSQSLTTNTTGKPAGERHALVGRVYE